MTLHISSAMHRVFSVIFLTFNITSQCYQNLRSRFGIERYAYTETNSVCMYVCMYVCMCKNSSQTTEPICIKLYQQIERLTLIAIGYLDLKYLPNTMNILSQRARRFCTGVSSPLAALQRIDNVSDVTE